MQLEHLNLVVKDMQQSLDFYQAAFPYWSIRGEGKQTWYGVERRWLHFGDNEQYLTFNDQGYGENRPLQGNQVGMAHFAYRTVDLDGLISRMLKAGYAIHHEGAQSPYRRNVYFRDPNDYEIEFVEYSSDLPEQRNHYD